jgi:hypothetical protein
VPNREIVSFRCVRAGGGTEGSGPFCTAIKELSKNPIIYAHLGMIKITNTNIYIHIAGEPAPKAQSETPLLHGGDTISIEFLYVSVYFIC